MTRIVFFVLAFVVAIPALVILANVTQYAFIGHGFLPTGEGDMNAARGTVAWLSCVGSVVLAGMGASQ